MTMLRLIFGCFLALVPVAARAQQTDPEIVVYRGLLADADARLAATVKQYEQALAALKKQDADLKIKCGAACRDDKETVKK